MLNCEDSMLYFWQSKDSAPSTASPLTAFEPKQCKQQVCKAKVKKLVDQALGLKCEKQEKMR